MTNQDRFFSYLRLYETKDLQQIADMLAPNVTLRDWKICVHGKAAALAETSANFKAAKSICILPLRVYETDGAVAGELKIVVDGQTELFVVDVLDFDHEGRITGIRAYLGRGE